MRRRYLLDTGTAQDYQDRRGDVRGRVLALRRSGHRVGICAPVLGELWSGVEFSSSPERNRQSLTEALRTLAIWPFSPEAAAAYGAIYAEMRQAGRVIQQIDMQIGAIARTLPNCVIVSKDADLKAIPAAIVEDWSS
jgi:tRNA(fMet)-specific endonuclease VapC